MNKAASSANTLATNKKSTVYVSGLAPEVDEEKLLQTFVTFGDIIEIKIPHEPHEPTKHKGYAFVTFSVPADAQEAIDNYDLNQLPGYEGSDRFLKCTLAQPNRFAANDDGSGRNDRAIWHTEEWKAEHEAEDGEKTQAVAE
ncbi:hypothetical protein L204_104018 [Cryptococcus depauperatus]|nr:cyclophilin [Cryptococcus depauperatus CBS 7855]